MTTASPIRSLVHREQRRQARQLVLAALCASGAAAAGVTLLGLSGWFLTAAAIAGAAGPLAVTAFNYLLPSAAIRFLAIARTGLRYGERLTGHAAALRALAEIRPALFAGLAAAPPEQALSLSSGEASARLVQDVDAIETLFVQSAAPWAALASALVAIGLIALASWVAALVFLAALAAQIAIGRWLGDNRSRDPAGQVLREVGMFKDSLQTYAGASAELRCYGFTDAAVDQLMAMDHRLGEAGLRSHYALAEMSVLQPAMAGLGAAGVLAACAHAPPALAALAALATMVALESAAGLLLAFGRNGAVETASDRLDEILSAPPAMTPRPMIGPRQIIDLRLDAGRYRLAPGERWALAGPSGAGKTRLLQALVGLRTPAVCEVMVEGRDLSCLAAGVARASFAYAPQEAPMISGTVRENLRLADPAADDAQLWRVLETAALADKVRAITGGLEAWVGEGGARLSGGERKRLSLARALLRPAPWLLLDEPTEGLDAATEQRVIKAVAAHLDRTGQGLILVSHRPAAMTLARNQIPLGGAQSRAPVDLDQGRVFVTV